MPEIGATQQFFLHNSQNGADDLDLDIVTLFSGFLSVVISPIIVYY